MSQAIPSSEDSQRRVGRRGWLRVVSLTLVLYLMFAYLLVPFAWKSYARHRPSFDDHPRITETGEAERGQKQKGVRHEWHLNFCN